MIRHIKKLEILTGLRLKVGFDDGRIVVYDVAEDVEAVPGYSPLRTEPALFSQARLDESRTCVYWNDRIDLPSDAIYEYGREIVPAMSG